MTVHPARRLFSVDEYHGMAKAGILNEDDRVELIEGEVVEIAPIGSRHAAVVKRLIALLTQATHETDALLSVQDPVSLSGISEPQPDLTLLKPRDDFYAGGHPRPDDVLLLIEVADSPTDSDRGVKVPLYARAGVLEVWLVVLESQQVEVYREPAFEHYASVVRAGRGEALSPVSLPGVKLSVDAILG